MTETDARHSLHSRGHLIWVIPIVAALIGGWLVLQRVAARGPTITVQFHSAEGLSPGRTVIRYKDVDVGTVSSVRISRQGGITVVASMTRDAEPFLMKDSKFWVVRPRISAGSISGLGTLFSGAYISFAAGHLAQGETHFVGLETPPVDTQDLPGREFVLHANDLESLEVGSPVLFRRVKAGQILSYAVDAGGHGVTLRAFIGSPFDAFVTQDTRFWQASGVDISVDSDGVRVQTQSIASILDGGVAFESPQDSRGAPPAAAGTEFAILRDRAEAMKRPYRQVHRYKVYFTQSLRGLSPGAPVDLHGIIVGEVQRFGLEFDHRRGVFRFPVEVNVYSERLREQYLAGAEQAADVTADEQRILVDRLVKAGMRAQLKTANLVTGQLYIALDFFPNAPAAKIDWNTAQPVMPAVSGGLNALTDSLGDIAAKINKVPIEELGNGLLADTHALNLALGDTAKLVDQLNAQVAPEARRALVSAQAALDSAHATLMSESPLQGNLNDALKQLSRAARSLTDLTEFIEQHPESFIRGNGVEKP
jgi:paraquat-inducible protein B